MSRASSSESARPSSPREPFAFLVLGRAVLRLLGQRHIRIDGLERRRQQLGLEALEACEIGTQSDDTEIGLVPQHRQRDALVTIGLERGERVPHVFPGAGVALGALAVDPVVEVENSPTDRRNDALHGSNRTRRSPPALLDAPCDYQCESSADMVVAFNTCGHPLRP